MGRQKYRVSLLGHRVIESTIEHVHVGGMPMWRLQPPGGDEVFVNPTTAVFTIEPLSDQPRDEADPIDAEFAEEPPRLVFTDTARGDLGRLLARSFIAEEPRLSNSDLAAFFTDILATKDAEEALNGETIPF